MEEDGGMGMGEARGIAEMVEFESRPDKEWSELLRIANPAEERKILDTVYEAPVSALMNSEGGMALLKAMLAPSFWDRLAFNAKFITNSGAHAMFEVLAIDESGMVAFPEIEEKQQKLLFSVPIHLLRPVRVFDTRATEHPDGWYTDTAIMVPRSMDTSQRMSALALAAHQRAWVKLLKIMRKVPICLPRGTGEGSVSGWFKKNQSALRKASANAVVRVVSWDFVQATRARLPGPWPPPQQAAQAGSKRTELTNQNRKEDGTDERGKKKMENRAVEM
jgi:hypothetical protein